MSNSQSSQAAKTLTAGYYYMQVICVNSWGTGHFKVMVDTPAIPNIVTPVNPTWQVHKIQIKPKQIREEILSHTFTQTTGSFKLEYQVWNS